MSDKLMLSQRVQILYNGAYTWNSVEFWIENHPELVYRHVYESKKNNLRRLQLSKRGIELLKNQLEKSHPELLKQISINKKRKSILKRLKKENYLNQNKK